MQKLSLFMLAVLYLAACSPGIPNTGSTQQPGVSTRTSTSPAPTVPALPTSTVPATETPAPSPTISGGSGGVENTPTTNVKQVTNEANPTDLLDQACQQ